jgi:serine/threonine protein kinase
MSAQPKRVTSPEVWTRWEGHLVKGVFPLRRFLGSSDQGAVFLSEYNNGKTSDVAIKIVPAVGSQAEARLAHWRTAAALSHPHLVRLFDMGRCQLGGREFLFIVMEYGEQTLAQFLSQRSLTSDEARALLTPTLDALAYLHGNQLVHAQLKPSNFLVVNDQLKLTSESVRPVGHRGLATADDICSLGITLVEAFTLRTPSSLEAQDEVSSLLANVPAAFGNTVRRCLHPNPASRPTVAEFQAQHESLRASDVRSEEGPRAHPVLLAIPAVLLFALAVWVAQHPMGNPQAKVQPPAAPAATPAPTPTPAPAPKPTKSATPAKPAASNSKSVASRPVPATSSPQLFPAGADPDSPVLVEVSPEVPRDIRAKIQGRILVTLRVLVDSSGNVMATMMEKPGPNRNLANLADQAARQWKFVPDELEANRVWILTFAFTREGVTARATGV